MNISEQLRLLKTSKQVHSKWYLEAYPEVRALKMEPALHYLRYGAAMGRNPGKDFDTGFYLRSYPDAAKSRMNPLVHYMLHGRARGYATRPPKSPGTRQVAAVRAKLLSLGFTERPLQELADLQANAQEPGIRAFAARELALWHMRQKTPEGYRTALIHLLMARHDAPDLDFRRKLSVAELLCHYFLGNEAEGRASHERMALAGEVTPDLILVSANFESAPEMRVALMNRVLRHHDIPEIALLPDETLSPYDRLTSALPLDAVADGPKVTVLIAAYDAADTLPTALRSLQEQTWKNLEILVLDDCSPAPGTSEVVNRFAAQDSRIRLIRMERNGGAYVARNRGLDESTGEYVTLHDADDWSHPRKIETQVRYLIGNPDVVGCLSEQARSFSDLTYRRWAGYGELIITNTSSFMFHKPRMKESAGYWDTVRFSADNELIRRIRNVHGKESVKSIKTGPLSFQRDSATSIIADAVMGINGFFFGARKEYLEAQTFFRRKHPEKSLYSGARADRPFPAPMLMLPDRRNGTEARDRLDVVIATDLRGHGESVDAVLKELQRLGDSNVRTGVFELNSYRNPGFPNAPAHMSDKARETIWESGTRILTFGEAVECGRLILWNPAVLQDRQRYLPAVLPDAAGIVMDDLSLLLDPANGTLEDAIARADRMAREYFGQRPTWYPVGPEMRSRLNGIELPIAISRLDFPQAGDFRAEDIPDEPAGNPFQDIERLPSRGVELKSGPAVRVMEI